MRYYFMCVRCIYEEVVDVGRRLSRRWPVADS